MTIPDGYISYYDDNKQHVGKILASIEIPKQTREPIVQYLVGYKGKYLVIEDGSVVLRYSETKLPSEWRKELLFHGKR